jgi:hypothetical protein
VSYPAVTIGATVSRRRYTDEQLASVVQRSTTIADVLRGLGLFPGGGNYETVKDRMGQLGLDRSHFRQYGRGGWIRRYSEAQIRSAVSSSRSLAQVFASLGEPWSASKQARLKQHLLEMRIDTTHFVGQGWRRGIRRPVVAARPLSQILVVGRRLNSHGLKQRLIQEGLKRQRCEICLCSVWNGEPIPLELDHINGRRDDNRLSNLRILCPNCHAQTDTYRGRNIGAASSAYAGGARVAESGETRSA